MPGPGMVGSDILLSPAGRWGLGKESERDVLKRFTLAHGHRALRLPQDSLNLFELSIECSQCYASNFSGRVFVTITFRH